MGTTQEKGQRQNMTSNRRSNRGKGICSRLAYQKREDQETSVRGDLVVLAKKKRRNNLISGF